MSESASAKFKVYVDDNYHYMDEEARYTCGEYGSYDEALVVCKNIVDEFLKTALASDKTKTAKTLLKEYKNFGEAPFICPTPSNSVPFSAWSYAEQRCKELCG